VEVARFCDAVRDGTRAEVSVNDGLWSVVVGVAAHRSIDEGRPVSISEFGLN
jgi:myo-inositol 2-dehydrogenase/D-chiro-inositol 1-dehydrogenase